MRTLILTLLVMTMVPTVVLAQAADEHRGRVTSSLRPVQPPAVAPWGRFTLAAAVRPYSTKGLVWAASKSPRKPKWLPLGIGHFPRCQQAGVAQTCSLRLRLFAGDC